MKRKKTRKSAAVVFFMLLLILVFAAVIAILKKPGRIYSNNSFDIPTYKSSVDMDGDGIDDQTDILQNVRAYLDTEPMYESRYYDGGYPDDEYGVCTDVVAFGMLDAGYDLRELVAEDIRNHPEWYDIETPDSNIDFRRVTVLKVFFDHHAISLTTDISRIEEWQGGDIVIFREGHIGVVSDKRSENGVPYVLHHGSPEQESYEQNILGRKMNDIVGHYRIS